MGKTAVITGAAGKLGVDITSSLARNGFNCLCLYNRSEAKAFSIAEHIRKGWNVSAAAVQADLAGEDTEQVYEKIKQSLASLNTDRTVLINSASIFKKDSELAEDEDIIRLNAIVPEKLSRCLFEDEKAGLESVVNISDAAAGLSWPSYNKYCRSKAELNNSTLLLAREFAPRVRVNAVSPGLINTEGLTDKEVKWLIGKIPLKRRGSGRDVSNAIVFLIKNSYITGQIINIDGGRTLND
ncbi:SDR family oxidoreductase [Sedimentisphaera salicampi]|uniref:3-oxoacyl-[acyl-carrier-protein] reductase FabG n=1 Tax=Sedimentisphaera salicampi TaxID=1941349 RepID=A0A1W6LLF4_9BACT|nr:SDR family oxidoreductase [Sedimentisphaera salicampi]ARN56574.1 3-oxoacyl-[acyl-carrier-protein] reductase FabG [Sedimentisphaera salicampi]OXU15466.1 3-oxoacyl-[acyl-carrier-protein] reductase FabG [Sedimentisphaera salicampi]